MNNLTTYVFHFKASDNVIRLPYAKWNRVCSCAEALPAYSNKSIYVAYAYLFLENRKPDYCPRIEGAIYYFDASGYVIKSVPKIDILKEMDEMHSDIIDFRYYKEKHEYLKQNHWQLSLSQIQEVIGCIWK